MGLFSFIKNVGAKLTGKKTAEKTTVVPGEAKENTQDMINQQKAEMMTSMIKTMGLDIDYLDIRVNDDSVTISGMAKSNADREKAILAVGNIRGIGSVEDNLEVAAPVVSETETQENRAQKPTDSTFYTVQSGDSLSKIAKAHYGNAMKYMAIFEANQPMLKNVDLIYPGQVLRIPPLD